MLRHGAAAVKRGLAPQSCRQLAIPPSGSAASTARITARARQSAAALPSRASAAGSAGGPVPVASAKTVSPSNGVWIGRMARASPSCAMIAKRRHPALSSAASVATTAIVVLAPGTARPHCEKSSRSSAPSETGGWRSISPASAKSAAQKRPQSARTVEPQLLTATIAPTVAPAGENERGAADPALQPAGDGAEPRPGIAEREVLRRGHHGAAAECPIRRLAGPCPPAGEAEVEQDRGRNDRHPDGR